MARRRAEVARLMVLGAVALGLLLWAKLRLVTTIPRTALAEPQSAPAVDTGGEHAADAQQAVAGVSEPEAQAGPR